jgi:hypothetical protein
VKLKINDSDVGVLYLKENEADLLLKTLRSGMHAAEVRLETNIYDDNSDFGDENDEDDNSWEAIK